MPKLKDSNCQLFIIGFRQLEAIEYLEGLEGQPTWRPRRDLNPCYRRESRPRVRN
jgi:hypothetical protein